MNIVYTQIITYVIIVGTNIKKLLIARVNHLVVIMNIKKEREMCI